MRKNWLAILCITAVLALGAGTISAYAAGWVQSGSDWTYTDSSGNKVTNEWKKGADDQWRYLNSSGLMATNTWVEDTYYVDANGLLTTDKWAKLENPRWDRYSTDDQYQWYYFGSSGKIITETWKKIDDKWYYFDEDGAMLTGWILDNMYFSGSDGAMKIGWQKLTPPQDDSYTSDRVSPGDADGDDKSWYYFSASGKKYVPELNGAQYGERKVDGAYYCFDEYGAMQTGWRNIKTDSDDGSIGDYKYFNTDGKARVGWLSLEPPEDIAANYPGDVEWFYFNSNGYPKVGKKVGERSTSDLVKINGLTYMFNELGNPVYGLQKVMTGNSSDSYTAYYFGDKATSSVVRGKKKIEEGDGSATEFYFAETGRGYTGVKDSYLYYMGKLQKAESGTKYQVFTVNGTNYVINTSGRIAKSTKVKDADGVEYKTGSAGNLTQLDGESPGKDKFNDPVEPVWFD